MKFLSFTALCLVLITTAYLSKAGLHPSTVYTENDAPDTLILPKPDSNYVVKILAIGLFPIDAINYDANTMEWYALFGSGDYFWIKKIRAGQTKVKDSITNIEKWEITGHDSLPTVLMTCGVELIEKFVYPMKLNHKTFNPGDRLEFNYNGKKFVIFAEADEVKDKKTKEKVLVNYKLYMAPLKKEKQAQLIAYHKKIEGQLPIFLFMGDMDNDKKPDFILNNTCNKTENHIMLYLSNNPPKGSFYKVMGSFNYKN